MIIKFEYANRSEVLKEFKEEDCFYQEGTKFKMVQTIEDFVYAVSKNLEFYTISSMNLGSKLYRRFNFNEITMEETAERMLAGDKSLIAIIDNKYYKGLRSLEVFSELVIESEKSSVVFLVQ